MKRTMLLILSILLLSAQAEEIDSPLVHAEEMPLVVDTSPVITFQTDEAGVFAVVVLASSEELSTPAPESSPAPSEELGTEGTEDLEEVVQDTPAFIISTRSTSRSLIYTFTPIQATNQGENP